MLYNSLLLINTHTHRTKTTHDVIHKDIRTGKIKNMKKLLEKIALFTSLNGYIVRQSNSEASSSKKNQKKDYKM